MIQLNFRYDNDTKINEILIQLSSPLVTYYSIVYLPCIVCTYQTEIYVRLLCLKYYFLNTKYKNNIANEREGK